jgi:hypothetical protein
VTLSTPMTRVRTPRRRVRVRICQEVVGRRAKGIENDATLQRNCEAEKT